MSRERFNFSWLEKISREKNRFEKFDKKNYRRKKLKLRSPLKVGEKILILAALLKKIYKSNIDKKSYFHKQQIFLITNRQKVDGKLFDWLKSTRTEKKLKYRFLKEEIFAISDNFNWFLHRF